MQTIRAIFAAALMSVALGGCIVADGGYHRGYYNHGYYDHGYGYGGGYHNGWHHY